MKNMDINRRFRLNFIRSDAIAFDISANKMAITKSRLDNMQG